MTSRFRQAAVVGVLAWLILSPVQAAGTVGVIDQSRAATESDAVVFALDAAIASHNSEAGDFESEIHRVGCEAVDCGDDCGCGDCCNSGCCSGDYSHGLFGALCDHCDDSCLGDPYTLADCMCCPITVGGWFSAGYHSDNTRQSFAFNDLAAYNDVPDQLNLHQGYLYFEKEAVADCCNGVGYGFRADIMYGTDAQSIQANGSVRAINNRNQGYWDASLDHGAYGWAIPQAYGAIAYNDWEVKVGYFLSLLGYESSLAPENFFYSHSLTMFNSEPFTHTGVLAENNSIDGLTLYAGWVMGWDAAWQQELGGSAFLGGFSAELTEDAVFTYILNAGDFGIRGNNGYNHSVVIELTLSEQLEYALQSDYLATDDAFGVAGDSVEQFGIVQYLYYWLGERVALGGRVEWWNSNAQTDTSQSYYEITGGLNYMPHPNLTIRPEIRYDWTPGDANFADATGFDYNNTVFGIDAVLTY